MNTLIVKEASTKFPSIGYTHGGIFHSDDVFCTALLKLLNPDFSVIRGFHPESSNADIIYDIGNGEFDHHQTPLEVRSNGVPYASFGKLWRKYGTYFLTPEEAIIFDKVFVEKIDAHDNGVSKSQLAEVISAMNPCWDEENPFAFDDAVAFATSVLKRMIVAQQSHERSYDIGIQACNQPGKIAVLDQFAPIMGQLAKSNKLFFVYYSVRGAWTAQAVKIPGSKEVKCPFPEEWRGAPIGNLPSGITFCHSGGFMIAGNTKEDVLRVCNYLAKE